jgi:hypothetical protein
MAIKALTIISTKEKSWVAGVVITEFDLEEEKRLIECGAAERILPTTSKEKAENERADESLQRMSNGSGQRKPK